MQYCIQLQFISSWVSPLQILFKNMAEKSPLVLAEFEMHLKLTQNGNKKKLYSSKETERNHMEKNTLVSYL